MEVQMIFFGGNVLIFLISGKLGENLGNFQ